MQLVANSDAPAQARAAVAKTMPDDPREEVVALATSEIVTNAIVHGGLGDTIEVRISRIDGDVRVEVYNAAAQPFVAPHCGSPNPRQFGGWGLGIVEAVSVEWGVDHADGRTLVWFVV